MPQKHKSSPLKIAAFALSGLLLLPVVYLIYKSFFISGDNGDLIFSLDNYKAIIQSNDMVEAIGNSVKIALITSLVASLLGTLLSWSIFKSEGTFKRLSMVFISLPLITPDIVLGLGLLILFVIGQVQLGWTSIIIAHITFCTAFTSILSLSLYSKKLLQFEKVSQDLGANQRQRFFWILLPLLKPAILASFLVSFILSMDDFTITFFTSSVNVTTLPLRIYSMVRIGISPVINALSTTLIIITLSSVFLIRKLYLYQLNKNDYELS